MTTSIERPRGLPSRGVDECDDFRVRLDVELARIPTADSPPRHTPPCEAPRSMDDSASFQLPSRLAASRGSLPSAVNADLDEVAAAWPQLPPLMRQAILRIIRSQRPAGER